MFLRHLSSKLPRRKSGPGYQFDDEVRLEYYRLQKISERSISLGEGQARRLDGPTEVGRGMARHDQVVLSQLIDVLNERFGTDFNQADQLFFDQIVETAMTDDGLKQAAAVNPEDKFELVFKQMLEGLFMERMDQNEDIFVRYMNDKKFQKAITEWMASEAYRKLREQQTTGAGVDAQAAKPTHLRLVEPGPEERYVTCIPLVPLKAAAGAFSDTQEVNDDDWQWVTVEGRTKPAPGLFVAQVVGESMNRRIPNGAWCIWRAKPAGTRQSKVVLAEHRDIDDPEFGGRYTVKVYESAFNLLCEPALSETAKSATTLRDRNHILLCVFPDFLIWGHENGHPTCSERRGGLQTVSQIP